MKNGTLSQPAPWIRFLRNRAARHPLVLLAANGAIDLAVTSATAAPSLQSQMTGIAVMGAVGAAAFKLMTGPNARDMYQLPGTIWSREEFAARSAVHWSAAYSLMATFLAAGSAGAVAAAFYTGHLSGQDLKPHGSLLVQTMPALVLAGCFAPVAIVMANRFREAAATLHGLVGQRSVSASPWQPAP